MRQNDFENIIVQMQRYLYFSLPQAEHCQGVHRAAGNKSYSMARFKIRAIAGYVTEPWTITSFSWEWSQVLL